MTSEDSERIPTSIPNVRREGELASAAQRGEAPNPGFR